MVAYGKCKCGLRPEMREMLLSVRPGMAASTHVSPKPLYKGLPHCSGQFPQVIDDKLRKEHALQRLCTSIYNYKCQPFHSFIN